MVLSARGRNSSRFGYSGAGAGELDDSYMFDGGAGAGDELNCGGATTRDARGPVIVDIAWAGGGARGVVDCVVVGGGASGVVDCLLFGGGMSGVLNTLLLSAEPGRVSGVVDCGGGTFSLALKVGRGVKMPETGVSFAGATAGGGTFSLSPPVEVELL